MPAKRNRSWSSSFGRENPARALRTLAVAPPRRIAEHSASVQRTPTRAAAPHIVQRHGQIWSFAAGAHPSRGDKTSTSAWYLNGTSSADWYWSDSWSFADKWRLMGIRLSRITGVSYLDQLFIGDVMEFDWGPNPDAYIDHAMFITTIDNYGEIYLTA